MTINWSEFEKEIEELSKKVNYTPDIVVGIVRGGIVPARVLASKLKVKDMYCLTVKKLGNERKIGNEIVESIKGKRILLVEDMIETGNSLIIAKKYLEDKEAIVKTACLYTMPRSEVNPDYFLRQINNIVHFPWE